MLRAISSDKKFIPHGILHYYSTGQTCEETVTSLLRSHEKMPQLFPRVHAQEVEFWYNSFKSGNFDLRQDPTIAPHSKLENLPVLHHVLHQVGTKEQKSLRRTCKQFKSMIEDEKRLFDLVEIRMSKNTVMLQIQSGITYEKIRTVYKKKEEGGCTITEGKISSESEKEFLEAALHDFSKTVEMIHTKIKKMIIKYSNSKNQDEDKVLFMTAVCDKMNSLKEKLYVEKLEICCREPWELDSILGALKPVILKEVNIDIYEPIRKEKKNEQEEEREVAAEEVEVEAEEVKDDENEEEEDDDDNEIELEATKKEFEIKELNGFRMHLPHLKELDIFNEPVDLKLENIVHIPQVFFAVAKLRTKCIKDHKEKLLQLPDFTLHQIVAVHSTQNNIMNWTRALEPFDEISPFELDDFKKDEDVISGQIPFKDGSGDMLSFEMIRGVKFERKPGQKKQLGGKNCS